MPKKRLGEVLVELGVINEDQLRTALEHCKKWNQKLGAALVSSHFITEAQLVSALSTHLGIPSVDLRKIKITDQLLMTISKELAQKHEVFPAGMEREGSRAILRVAMSDPTNINAVNEIEFATGYKISPVLAEISQIAHMIRKYYLKIDYEPLAFEGAQGFDSMSQYFPAEMNVLHEGKVTKAGTGEFKSMVIPEAPAREPSASRPPSRETTPPRSPDEAKDIDVKLMALLKLLIQKRMISKEEYLAELQILLAAKEKK
jgi:hypothetical protein